MKRLLYWLTTSKKQRQIDKEWEERWFREYLRWDKKKAYFDFVERQDER